MKKRFIFIAIAFVLLFFSIAANNEFEVLGDTQDYLAMAQSFVEGNPLQDPSRPFFSPLILHPPLYSEFLALFFLVFGFSYFGAKIVSILFGILCVIAFYFLLKKLGTKHKELVLVAFSTSIVFLYQANRILSDTVFLTFCFIAIYFLLDFEKTKKAVGIYGLLSAVFLALAFYARVAAVPLLLSVIAYFLLNKKWEKAVFISAVFGFLTTPWLIFFVNHQFFSAVSLETPVSYLNWATQTWAQTQSGPLQIAEVFFYNLFYYVFEGIPKTIFPLLLPLFFLKNNLFFPLFYIAGGIVFWFFARGLWKEKKSLFGAYIIIYILFFSVQPALDNLAFVDRYMFALFPFFLIILSDTLENGFFKQKKLGRHILLVIIVAGSFLSLVYAVSLKERLVNENYSGMKDSIEFIKNNVNKNELVVFHAPIHLYLNTGNRGTKNLEIADKIMANYILIDQWEQYGENDFNNFSVVFESENKTSKVLKRKS